MKRPTLIVEGERYPVITLEWHDDKEIRAHIMRNGVYTTYHNSNVTLYHVEPALLLDFEKALVPSTDDSVDAIRKRIEGYEEIMNNLERDFLIEYRKHKKAPFTSESLNKIDQQHERLHYIVDGLNEAVSIILNKGGEK